jgi:hypothetical protein
MFLVVAISAFAADVTGKWVAQVPGRGGETREVVYTFKAEGDKLTGTQSGFGGGPDIPISDGKITGDSISFKVNLERGGNTMTFNYTGKVSGNEIKMTREGGRGPQEFTAKKQ